MASARPGSSAGDDVRVADEHDLEQLPAVEAAADELFRARGITDLPPPASAEERRGAWRVLVTGRPVHGFAVLQLVDGAVHLEQLSVHPDSGRQGIGGALLAAVVEQARIHGVQRVTLLTYADVPWNAPWYARHGWRETADLGPGLRALCEHERELGLDRHGRRVAMMLQVDPFGVPLAEVVAALESRYDPDLAETWDAVGLVCGDPTDRVRRVLFAVDPVCEVVDEALETGADLVVTHHPLLLTPVHGVPADDPKGRLVHRLIRAGAGLFVAHTNADRAAVVGVNDALAGAVGLVDPVPLQPVAPGSRQGLGRLVRLEEPLTLRGFAERVAAVLPRTVGGVRIAGDPEAPVRMVAVCGGSGGSVYPSAAAAGADVLLTSDLKHHPVSESQQAGGPAVCEVAHFAGEWPWLPVAAELLRADLSGRVEVAVSARRTDPWTWHVSQDAERPLGRPAEDQPRGSAPPGPAGAGSSRR